MSTHPILPDTPHPALAQLAEAAAKETANGMAEACCTHGLPQPYEAIDSFKVAVKQVILRHLSSEWERMVRERDKYVRLYEEEETMRRNANKNNAALRSENERLTKERDRAKETSLVFARGETALQLENEKLRTRLRELEEDKARLDWLEANGAELSVEWDDGEAPLPWPEFRVRIKNVGAFGICRSHRAAIDAARKTQP